VVRAGRRAWINSIRASSPHTSGSSGLGAEVVAGQGWAGAGRVPLVEDQVEDGQDRPQAIREIGLARDPIGDAGVADLALRADDALRHRGLGYQERSGDLRRAQPAQQPQRECDLGGLAQRRMAAREDQPQPVVAEDVGALIGGEEQRGLRMLRE
jgi:hypothetical protein